MTRSARSRTGRWCSSPGVLLIVPGFFTDALGLLLLVPPLRAALIRWGAARTTVRATTVRAHGPAHRARARPRPSTPTTRSSRRPRGPAPGGSGWTRQH